MNRVFVVLVITLLLLGSACTKKSTEPEQKPPEDYSLVATQTIGWRGGSIQTDDFLLEVPDGAFGSNFELKLYASSKDKPFGDNCASRTFRLEGLPDEYAQPLRVSIEYEGMLSDSSFIAVGEEAMVAGGNELDTAYQIFCARDSAGCLYCELPASDGGAAYPKVNRQHNLTRGGTWRLFTVASKYLTQCFFFTKDYYIWVPSGVSMSMTELADLLDEAYKTFMDMGFSISYVPDVIVRDYPYDWLHDVCKFKYRNRDKYGYLEVNASHMTPAELPTMRMQLGCEVFRVIQFTYDPEYPVMVGPAQQAHYWLNEATVAWCEEKFVPEEERRTYVPVCFPDNEMAPFNGMQAGIHLGEGDAVRAQDHGCGMSSVIEFFTGRYYLPDSVLYFIHRDLSAGKHPVRAVLNCVQGEIYNEWWHTFLAAYVETYVDQDIYNVGSWVFTRTENVSGVFDIESDDDTLATFKGNYPDLSARLYRINLKHKTISENAQIMARVTCSGDIYNYVKIYAFKFDADQRLRIIDHHNVLLGIENVRELTDEGTDIIIMVVNSLAREPDYTGNSEIELEVKVLTEEFWECQIWFELYGYFKIIWDSSPDTYGWRTWWPNWDRVRGSFSGDNFDVDWDTTDAMGDPYTGFMRIKLNPTRDTVKSVVASATYVREYGEAQLSLQGWDIPLYSGSVSHPYYRVGGEEACDHIGQIIYRWQRGSVIDTLLEYECNAESYMSISLDKVEE